MEVLIDHFGEFPPEAAYLNEIIDAGTQYSLQAAELLQQLASFHRAQARDGFKYRLAVAFGAFAPQTLRTGMWTSHQQRLEG